ncbi:MAG: helix-turn-helix domain-containing protein [Sulfobacillus sp.]
MRRKPFFTVRSLAKEWRVQPLTIYRLIRRGELPVVRIGRCIRLDPKMVAAYLKAVRAGPDEEDLNDGILNSNFRDSRQLFRALKALGL